MSVLDQYVSGYLLRPIGFLQKYDKRNLRPDFIAGATVAVILLPQAIAFALVAELPARMGLYTAIVAAVVAALWGSSNQVHTGPANTISLLVLSALMTTAAPGMPPFPVVAGVLAVMVGLLQLVMGLAGLGVLVNFVSHSVIVGFAGGAGVLIAVKELRYLLGLQFQSSNVLDTLSKVVILLPDSHFQTATLGLLTLAVMVAVKRWTRLPGPLVGMVLASLLVFLLKLDEYGVAVVGELPRSLPPLANLPIFNLDLIARLSTGALAIGAIGLVETTAIARSFATQTGQRLDNNQEFVGQGLANVVAGFLSGFPSAGSFSRSAVNFESGARSPMSSVFSALGVLVALFTLAPLTGYLPRTALAAVLIIASVGLVDHREIARILRGTKGDSAILLLTFLGTLFLQIEFAVLAGIMLSFAVYIMKTSVPRVHSVLPDDNFRHFAHQPDKQECPQLGIVSIQGDLYFGAVSHVEKAIYDQRAKHPRQKFLLLRMKGVHTCDFTGIHALESIVRLYREEGGDVYLTRVQDRVLKVMKSTRFFNYLGADHFLSSDNAIDYLFHRIIDPAICIYECPVRAFTECQNLPKLEIAGESVPHTKIPIGTFADISAEELKQRLQQNNPPCVVDVREPREFRLGHIPNALLIPLPKLIANGTLPDNQDIVLVCRGGRRSSRAAYELSLQGRQVSVLSGGMLAWENARFLEAVD